MMLLSLKTLLLFFLKLGCQTAATLLAVLIGVKVHLEAYKSRRNGIFY